MKSKNEQNKDSKYDMKNLLSSLNKRVFHFLQVREDILRKYNLSNNLHFNNKINHSQLVP